MLPETSVNKHQSTPRSTVEERSLSVQTGESLKSGDNETVSVMMQGTPSEIFNQNFKQQPCSTGLCNIQSFFILCAYIDVT